MKKNRHMDALFTPDSVAIIGASEGKAGGGFFSSLLNNGFQGACYAVNPKKTEIMGRKAYASVLDIPGAVDLVVITIPSSAMPRVMAECAQKGVKAAIIFSAGFREAGDEGRELERRVLEAARQGNVRIIGPNCMGVYNPAHGLNTIAAHIDTPREAGRAAFIGQSGWASENFIVAGTDRGLRLSKVISCGNQADLTVTDYLDYFGHDPETRFIGIYMEGLTDGQEFFQTAREVSIRKPVVIWKAGVTGAGARAVASHTASLAGSDLVWGAVFNQAGIIRAVQFDEILDFAIAFGCSFLPKGNRVGIIGEAGGGGAAGSDAAESAGLRVPQFSDQIQERLRRCLAGSAAPFSSIRNPVDLVSPNREDYTRFISECISIMAEEVDALIFFTYYPLTQPEFLETMKELCDTIAKPLFIVPGYATRAGEGLIQAVQQGLPALPTPERAARGIWALRKYARFLERQGTS